MSTWRRKALESFPELQGALNSAELESPYDLWFVLGERERSAYRDGDTESLDRIYAFAAWSLAQPGRDVWNAAGVMFYEHVLENAPPQRISFVLDRIDDRTIAHVWSLWDRPEVDLAHVVAALRERRRPVPSTS